MDSREQGKGAADPRLRDLAAIESEALFRSQFTLGNIGIAFLSAERHWLRANPRLCELLGYSEVELRQITWPELAHPDDRAADAARFGHMLAGEIESYDLDERFIRKDGSVLFARLTVSCPRGPDGAPSFVLLSLVDISDRVAAEEALRQSQSMLNGIFRSAPIGIGVVSRRVFQWTNDRLCEMTGYAAAEMAGQSARMLCACQEDFDRVGREKYDQIHVRGTGMVETRWQCKDGHLIDVLLSSTPLEPGELDAGVVFTALDITERKRNEEALRLRDRAVASSLNAVVIAGLDGRIADTNDAFMRMWGYSPEEATELTVRQLGMDPDDVDGFVSQIQGNGFAAGESIARHKDGTPFHIQVSASLVTDASGAPAGMLSTFIDITERKRAEEALLRSEAVLRSMLDATQAGVGLLVNRRFQQVNASLCRITGYSREELLGLTTRVLYPSDEEFERVGRVVYPQIEREGLGSMEARMQHKSGAALDVILTLSPFDPANPDTGVTATVLDITERKQAERERLELERQLLHAQKLESLGILAGGIAHDFNNLLMAILGNLDVALLDLSPNSPARARIGQAVQAVRRATDLTRQMLAYSGKGKYVVTRMDLSNMVRENADLFRTAIPKTVAIHLLLATEPAVIEADPGQVQQVVMNLITNAAEAIGEQPGAITITTGVQECDEACLGRSRIDERPPAGRFVFLEVSDNGCGMDEDARQRLFDPFFTTKFTGRGLGMSAVLGIVRGHGGAILVDSAHRQGTTVRVLFPACEPHAETPHAAQDAPTGASDLALGAGVVLVVDDEEVVRGLCAAFVEHFGFTALQAADGEEALALFEENAGRIACVLLDLTMPRLDGVRTFQEMKRRRPEIPVILSSGYNQQDATRRFTGEGLAGFIQKPYRFEELKAVMDRVVSRRPGSSS